MCGLSLCGCVCFLLLLFVSPPPPPLLFFSDARLLALPCSRHVSGLAHSFCLLYCFCTFARSGSWQHHSCNRRLPKKPRDNERVRDRKRVRKTQTQPKSEISHVSVGVIGSQGAAMLAPWTHNTGTCSVGFTHHRYICNGFMTANVATHDRVP